ncbi:MAG: AMP-binding protein [Actinomycetota bacterium]|nr:AMP-binding protein [Actinomycetota bacterium]
MARSDLADLAPTAHVDTFCRDHLPPRDDWPELILDVPGVSYPPRLNCAVELLDVTCRRLGPDRTCIVVPDGDAVSYGELTARVNRLANVLTGSLGIEPGNRVLLRGPNNAWLATCWLAVLKAGAVAVTTMPLLRASELSTVAEIARIDLALCDVRFVDDLRKADLLGAKIVTYGPAGELDALVAAASSTFTAVDTAADDVALLAFTSGTTGRPKATMHFHRDVLAIADTFSKHVVRIGADDVVTGTPHLAFTFGLGGLLVFPLRAGAATLLLERATPVELAEAIAKHRASICFTAPTAYRAMLTGDAASNLGGLRCAVAAGEHLPEATWHAFHDRTGVKIIDGIGATELLHVFISAADDDIRPGATGKAVPGYRATILDDDGRSVPAGTPGRLAVKGPTGCRYLSDPRQQNYVRNGWNLTGDVFRQDADGYFFYEARADDMIVSSGYNIAGPEVEEALLSHPQVAECAVVAAADPERGHVVKAFVVLVAGIVPADDVARALQEFVKQQIAPYKYPRQIEFVAALPRTSTGKIQRYVLRNAIPGERACE